MILRSSAFQEGGSIPSLYTCDGRDISPPLTWGLVPEVSKSLALICEDPDAPAGLWIHWLIFNIPPAQKGLVENIPNLPALSGGIVQGKNTSGETGYSGPCPPRGVHRYFFRLYALDILMKLGSETRKEDLMKAAEGHILARAELMGRYLRK